MVARTVADLVRERRPDITVEHIGSSAVPGMPGKNVVDLAIDADPADVPQVNQLLLDLGFQPQPGRNPWPPTRPMPVGSLEVDGETLPVHIHVYPRGHRLFGGHFARDVAFRDALRNDASLREDYAARKREIVADGVMNLNRYSLAKSEWIRGTLAKLGLAFTPILPPATIGILGGGQLGRMFALAARSMGYRIAVLDPDAACPAAPLADEVVKGAYDDLEAALELAARCALVTYELEHVDREVVARLAWDLPVRPGQLALTMTQNRILERRFLEEEGAAVAPWREVHDAAELRAAVAELGAPVRLKVATGGYDGRGQVRLEKTEDAEAALAALDRPAGEALLVEREIVFVCELSIVCVQGIDGRAVTYPVARNRHDEGILVESVVPSGVEAAVAVAADRLVRRLAVGIGLEGTLTAELFLLEDGSLVVNELAPRVHNTGHWTVDVCRTSQFEQHVRAICGLPLGSVERHAAAALVNLLGTGSRRAARLIGLNRALAVPASRVELYDKREVFERRKMGHVVAVADDPDAALANARAAAQAIAWAD